MRRSALKRGRLEADDEDGKDAVVKRFGNRVFFHSPITRGAVLTMLEEVRAASNHALETCESLPDAKVYLYIHSEGGDAYAGLSAMGHLMANKVPIVTIADGFVASAATFLLLAGKHRRIHKHTQVLIHQLQTEFWGKYSDLVDEWKNSRSLMRQIHRIYQQHSSLSSARIASLLKQEVNMTCKQAIEWGFVEAYC